jgi:hypothetical protein
VIQFIIIIIYPLHLNVLHICEGWYSITCHKYYEYQGDFVGLHVMGDSITIDPNKVILKNHPVFGL